MIPPSTVLTRLLQMPELASGLGPRDWETLIAQAHATGLAARLGTRLRTAGLGASLPPAVELQIRSAENLARRQYQQTLYEIGNLTQALRAEDIPAILLKGAAYIALGVPAGDGRHLSDIDLMVPQAKIGEAESALMRAGWVATERDAYTQRYYREWMHEIPPLVHVRRHTVVDLHHTILPPTARHRIDAAALFRAARSVPGIPCLTVLSPVDMVIHSAVHLFHEGEFDRGLRDLSDLDGLITHFVPQETDFRDELVVRARELGVMRSLFYAVRYCHIFLGTPVPAAILTRLSREGPGGWHVALMDSAFVRALKPHHPSSEDALTPAARFLLYVRSHWLRMPVRLLIPHLVRKFWMRRQAAKSAAA
ncbi:MAG TPA: nucleotidyltransferase family protein [Rhodocyclaceae bacterium]|nr:nucleotidyltransferase family protein [Rhodocyclaceae bacterium]